jgi:hypothetical protein
MFKITPRLLDQNGGTWCVTLISFGEHGWHMMVFDGSYWQFIPDPPYGFSSN